MKDLYGTDLLLAILAKIGPGRYQFHQGDVVRAFYNMRKHKDREKFKPYLHCYTIDPDGIEPSSRDIDNAFANLYICQMMHCCGKYTCIMPCIQHAYEKNVKPKIKDEKVIDQMADIIFYEAINKKNME